MPFFLKDPVYTDNACKNTLSLKLFQAQAHLNLCFFFITLRVKLTNQKFNQQIKSYVDKLKVRSKVNSAEQNFYQQIKISSSEFKCLKVRQGAFQFQLRLFSFYSYIYVRIK